MKTPMRYATAICAITLFGVISSASAQDKWSWHKVIGAGHTVEIKGINGDISATAASGSEVEVFATKTARKSNPDDVKIEVIEHEGDVTICAVYPTPRLSSGENQCAPGNHGHMNTRNNDTNVHFDVRLPRGVRFEGRTVNGDIDASGLTANASASTVNGSVKVSTTGIANANTVNGGIRVRMGSAISDDIDFSTVNGSIVVESSGSMNADVDAQTVNGSMSSDWPLTLSGKWGPRRMRGKIGAGGHSLSLSTVNGGIELRKVD